MRIEAEVISSVPRVGVDAKASLLKSELIAVSASNAAPAIHKGWEAEDYVSLSELSRRGTGQIEGSDRRLIPKTHDCYDLAKLSRMPEIPRPSEKAAKKYNKPTVGLVADESIRLRLELYNKSSVFGGVPGFIDAFLRGEPGGRTEGYLQRPEQFCTTSFHPRLGGFIISPNQSNIPERGQSYTDDSATILERTRGKAGFGLVAYWIPPCTYERYPMFQKLFPDTAIPDNAPAVEASDSTSTNRQERRSTQESNETYKLRSGVDFLSVPLNLRREHVPLLKELREQAIVHLEEQYKCDAAVENVEIYTHGPFYLKNSCGFHVHIRVNVPQHPLETDLRIFNIDDVVKELDGCGRINFSGGAEGSYLEFSVEEMKLSGLKFKEVPNVWAEPAKEELGGERGRVSLRGVASDSGTYKVPEKSAKKYDRDEVGLVALQALKLRVARYGENKVVPDFVHEFLTNPESKKAQSFFKCPEQFAATRFSEEVGGIFIMPNSKHIPGKFEVFPEPGSVRKDTLNKGGFALVAYWVPPKVYEAQLVFEKLFNISGSAAEGDCSRRETIDEYKTRTGLGHITNAIDVKKAHLSMLEEFKVGALDYLFKVFEVTDKDRVDFYLHSPIYGNKTAGLHIHVRVNQRLPAGELDTNALKLDTLISILKDEGVKDDDIMMAVLDSVPKTKSGKYFMYTAAWGKKQFDGIDVEFVGNPWRRPN
ncbi:hypothetical protein HU715_004165 [Pseudomonas sp. SWRI12]|uniref:Uncharacterized protein n=1 Tax=Pseudomonas zanjanensis TaxID=2745496 RepID=A0A923JJ79_9PSED|nr:hypothetical protein [Pseudomonas zanjanensis]MBV4494546.1 hypothetical protein [Pseudomonas zanjanensis]